MGFTNLRFAIVLFAVLITGRLQASEIPYEGWNAAEVPVVSDLMETTETFSTHTEGRATASQMPQPETERKVLQLREKMKAQIDEMRAMNRTIKKSRGEAVAELVGIGRLGDLSHKLWRESKNETSLDSIESKSQQVKEFYRESKRLYGSYE